MEWQVPPLRPPLSARRSPGRRSRVLVQRLTRDEFDGSIWAQVTGEQLGGLPPAVDLDREKLLADVLTAAQQRIEWTFDNFPRIYCSFSAGKDSGVMAHLVLTEARKRGRKVGLFFLDWEAQFTHTIDFARAIFAEYADCIEPYWCAVPSAPCLHLPPTAA
jgi:hypothetical protein